VASSSVSFLHSSQEVKMLVVVVEVVDVLVLVVVDVLVDVLVEVVVVVGGGAP
jgi:hypothetical protein